MSDTNALMPAIILVEPQLGENIGATARSMLNFGLDDLRIVSPRDGWPNPKAVDMAKGAKEVIHNAKIYHNLDDAVHDVGYIIATTARNRDMVKHVGSPRQLIPEMASRMKQGTKSAILFGPERTGLINEHIMLANSICVIPVSERYTSLNIAQAVAVLCYEWFSCTHEEVYDHNAPQLGESNIATAKEVAGFLGHLEEALDATDFLRIPEKKRKMMLNIGNIFTRANLTDQDVRTLRGIVRSLSK